MKICPWGEIFNYKMFENFCKLSNHQNRLFFLQFGGDDIKCEEDEGKSTNNKREWQHRRNFPMHYATRVGLD